MFSMIMKMGARKVPKPDTDTIHRPSSPTASSVPTVNHSSLSVAPTAAAMDFSLPLFRDVPAADRHSLFLRKLQICSIVFDFSDPSCLRFAREKEAKRQTLAELVDFLQSSSASLPEPAQDALVRAVSANIFRPFPPAHADHAESAGEDDDEPSLDPSWPHLRLAYELLLRYLASAHTDPSVAKRYLDHTFVLHILDLFETEDPREREYLKTVLHRIYGKFMVHRPFIRRSINNVFYRFIFEIERHSGICELLEILGSIINGFALPMKEEHKLFLVRALIPLHKPKSVAAYHQQLSYCVTQFVEKDYKLADTVVRGLLKYWPVTNCGKEMLFLGELEEVLEATRSAEFQKCMVPLFKQIGRCLNSSHFQVAERALLLWNNDHIMGLIAQHRNAILPIIFQALEKNIQSHWNLQVHGLTENVQKMFLEMDSNLFEECRQLHIEKEAKAKSLEEQRELTWRRLEAVAASQTEDMVLVN